MGELPSAFQGACQGQGIPGKKFPEVSVELKYNLAGQRGRATIQTRYASLADYDRIDAEVDNNEEYSNLLESIIGATVGPPVDRSIA